MRCLYLYRIYVYLLATTALLSSCATSHKGEATATNEPVSHSKEKEIKEKYATILGVPASDVDNYPMYAFIDAWWGAPYKYAGHSRDGVDCSDFVSILYDKVYNSVVSGPCVDLYNQCKPVKEAELKEGDLVFFKINSSHVSHVGVYLTNNKFVHASVHSGVVISDLTETYYHKYFYKAGRLKNSLTQNTYKG